MWRDIENEWESFTPKMMWEGTVPGGAFVGRVYGQLSLGNVAAVFLPWV